MYLFIYLFFISFYLFLSQLNYLQASLPSTTGGSSPWSTSAPTRWSSSTSATWSDLFSQTFEKSDTKNRQICLYTFTILNLEVINVTLVGWSEGSDLLQSSNISVIYPSWRDRPISSLYREFIMLSLLSSHPSISAETWKPNNMMIPL